ncbi:hypothetical protein BD410DRAFT_796960 [Rickenella mellea]|uniref:Aminoglycoside phosphotransferase domain-containing protein n=1 Tax=Rickenella mellea TaxID=50990 RepID=A0A4Y7PH21_9AGAM|nr:hypothetical protein BD410DRAFT_796960 [Rickenella mellea]
MKSVLSHHSHAKNTGIVDDDETAPPSESDSNSDVSDDTEASETSTIMYSQESFETYKDRVTLLLASLLPQTIASPPTINRLQGGSYNRVVGITLTSTCPEIQNKSQDEELILRVPRDVDDVNVACRARVLIQLRKAGTVPVPEVLFYDATRNNALDSPYIIMRRIEGEGLDSALKKMNHQERLGVAREMAKLLAQMYSTPVPPDIGPLCASDDSLEIGRFTRHGTFEYPTPDYSPPSTLLAFCQTRFTEHANGAIDLTNTSLSQLYHRIRRASKTFLRMHGYSSSKFRRYVIHHRDLVARHVLVKRVSVHSTPPSTETYEWKITGILDWDECEVAPALISFSCPGWLWRQPYKGPSPDSFQGIDCDPDAAALNEEYEEIKQVFLREIEVLLPGFVDVVRKRKQTSVKKLFVAEMLLIADKLNF